MEAELQKICDDITALMDKSLIPSARRVAGAQGHQQSTLKRSSSLSESIMNRSPRSDRQHRKPRKTRILRSRVICPRTHSTTQGSCCDEQQELVKKPLEDQAEALTEIHSSRRNKLLRCRTRFGRRRTHLR